MREEVRRKEDVRIQLNHSLSVTCWFKVRSVLDLTMGGCSLCQRVELPIIIKIVRRDEVLEVEGAIYPVDSPRSKKGIIRTNGLDYFGCVVVCMYSM